VGLFENEKIEMSGSPAGHYFNGKSGVYSDCSRIRSRKRL